MILTVTLNPAVDQQIFVDRLRLGDTNRVLRTEIDAGGKGINLSRVFAEMGGKTMATGFLGGNAAAIIRRVMRHQGCGDHFIEIAGETRINVSVEDESGAAPTSFNEKGPMISEPEWAQLQTRVETLSTGASWMCLGGSLPPGLPITAYRELAHRVDCKVMVDADGEAAIAALEARPDFIKPNTREAERLLGHPLPTTKDLIAGARQLRELLKPTGIVVITRGEKGAVLASAGGVLVGESAPVEAKSTVGSGDSFLGGMLWAMEEGQTFEEAFRWGLAAGAATATTDGMEIGRRRVIELLHRHVKVRDA